MGYEATAARLLPLFALLLSTSAPGGWGHRRGASVNPPLEAVPEHPRHVALAVHSRAGSSQSLVAAALDLLEGTDQFQTKGSTILWYEDRAAPSGYHVVGGYSFLTSASIAQVQAALRSIEDRLGGQDATAGTLLKTDLLWVEGVRADTPALKLPNPAILDTPWGIDAFVASSEDPFADACEQHREDRDYCRAVAKASRKPKVRVFETAVDAWVGGEVDKDGHLEGWAHARARDEEILAAAVDALLATDVARLRLASRGADAARHLFEDASEAVTKRRPDEVIPVEVPVPPGRIEDKVKAWIAAVGARVNEERLIPRRAVVFDLGADRIRGAILGRRLVTGIATPVVAVSSVEVIEGGSGPGAPRAFSVSLRVDPAGAAKK